VAPAAARSVVGELLEVQLVNAVAPFIINARLKALMLRTPGRDKYIVNVAARRTTEQRFHPSLDIVDGAARIVDPIILGFNTGTHGWGSS
jgi:hypothetical protein